MTNNIDMFTYNSNDEKNKSALAGVKAIVLEILIVGILCLLLLATLNYFKIISVSTIVPFFSFLPQQGLTSNKVNLNVISDTNPSPTGLIDQQLFTQGNPNIKANINTVEFETQITEISTKSGIAHAPSGDQPYVVMLKTTTANDLRTFYFNTNQMPKITVVMKVNGQDKVITFDDLKIGDKIDMTISNDIKNKKLISLKIVKI